MRIKYVIGRRIGNPERMGSFVELEEEEDTDTVRSCNEGLVYKRMLEEVSGDFLCSGPEEVRHDFEIILSVSKVKRMTQVLNVDYQRVDCTSATNWMVDSCMEIYRVIKRQVREKHKAYEEQHPKK